MSSTFQVETTFTITGRGLVVAGQILEGRFKVGARAALPDGGRGTRMERITGLEFIDGRDDDGKWRSAVGLLLGDVTQDDIPAIRARLTPGMRLMVTDAEPDTRPAADMGTPSASRPGKPRPWWRFWSSA